MTAPRYGDPRRSGYWQRLRRTVERECLPCNLCGNAIDYALPALHPMAYQLHHLIPLAAGGDPFDRSNVAPTHRKCNARQGDRVDVPEPTSREW